MNFKSKSFFVFTAFILLTFSCTTTDIPIPDTVPIVKTVTYDDDVKTIVDTNCISCHSSTGSASFLLLTTYDQVKTAALNRGMLARLNSSSNPMPPSGKLIQATLDLIDKWKDDGFLEN